MSPDAPGIGGVTALIIVSAAALRLAAIVGWELTPSSAGAAQVGVETCRGTKDKPAEPAVRLGFCASAFNPRFGVNVSGGNGMLCTAMDIGLVAGRISL